MSLRHEWNIANQSDIQNHKDVQAMVGMFGRDAIRFKANIDSRNFGEEVFEFDMESNHIKRFEKGWEWQDFIGSVGSYQRFGFDPFEQHIPNAVAFTHDFYFYKPDYSVLYWKRTENGFELRNKLVEVKGTRNIKNQDYELYLDFQRKVVDPHNKKIREYAKDHFIQKCLLEFEIFVYPTAYATGFRDPQNWNPSVEHTSRLEIFTIDELEAVWNKTPRDYLDERMQLDTSSIFDPKKVNAIDGIDHWSDDHYKKKIFKSY